MVSEFFETQPVVSGFEDEGKRNHVCFGVGWGTLKILSEIYLAVVPIRKFRYKDLVYNKRSACSSSFYLSKCEVNLVFLNHYLGLLENT